MIDPLTGIYNRQGMYSTVEKSQKFINANKIGIIMFDIDHFKSVNDNYGHNIGDVILSEFAKILQDNLDAVLCRWGGEEFIAVFDENSVNLQTLENIKSIVGSTSFTAKGGIDFNITTSIGYYTENSVNLKNIDSLIENADKALYYAKKTGRNKIVDFNDIPASYIFKSE